jgi:gamma-glutamylcyclotransferase (GGCT)/AIG2-like uncharacterized protein YtfP
MNAEPVLLFVYGTLLSGDAGPDGRAQRDRLARVSRVIASASVSGRLYHLGRYPGLALDGGPDDVVLGELIELATPTTTLVWLDDYEGIVPGAHTHNEYERRTIEVMLASGELATAWSYVYRQPTTGKPRIASGRWLDER